MSKAKSILYGVMLDRKFVVVMKKKSKAKRYRNLHNQISRLTYFEYYQDEYGKNQIWDMWKLAGDHYTLGKLHLIASSNQDHNDNDNWRHRLYKNRKIGEHLNVSDLEDIYLKRRELDKEFEKLEETYKQLDD
ncbi:hypothetical protein PQ460_10575 [Paenibacillus sp. KACC 21273]|uniref:hypothetical protein n=1 Tax=Paenibacillus sp. KACC 21273 TaxID=3025665 RepID=UPI0023669855|nr:hypothetical protein [Paenibacillus sp. KACC 21273]WDF52828.1 hypothetical protein PQ460_10575 [Paenibacillus sp. KACC 21273]